MVEYHIVDCPVHGIGEADRYGRCIKCYKSIVEMRSAPD